MSNLIKDYQQVLEQLQLNTVVHEVYSNKSRVKRSLQRLIAAVREDNKYAKMILKSYYKLYLLEKGDKSTLKLRSNNILVLPFMAQKSVKVYNGKTYTLVKIKNQMFGKFLGEFINTRNKGKHSSKGLSGDKIKR